jgi:trigger factor
MKVTVENISAVKKKMQIEVEPAAVALELAKAVSKISKKAQIPGFRPGKAPRDVVERHYGEDLKSEVLQQLVSEAYQKAMQEHDFVAVTMPQISDVSELNKDKTLTFTASVEVRPKIELGEYTGVEVKDPPVTVTSEEVDETISRLREMYSRLDVVEGQPLAKDHTAIIDFEGFHEGKPLPNAKATDFMLHLGMDTLLPEFEDQLAGMRKGETKEVKVAFPQDYSAKELAGKDATFTVTLKEVKRKVLPELNDEFAKDIGDNNTVDELKARIREDIEARKRSELTAQQKDDLLAKLIDSHTFDVPEGLVEQELNFMANQQAAYLQRQGADLSKGFDIAEFKEKNRDMAVKRVKGIVILQDIADRENIKISDNDVSVAMASIARNSGQKLEQVFKYYEAQPGGLDNLRESLLAQKTLAFLLSKAKKV